MKTLNLSLFSHLSGVKGKEQKGELTPYAKDVGVLHLMFALILWLVGIILLVIIHLELTEWGIEYISDNPFYCLVPVVLGGLKDKLNPWFVTGFVDGEGCFRISVIENKKKWGWIKSSTKISNRITFKR